MNDTFNIDLCFLFLPHTVHPPAWGPEGAGNNNKKSMCTAYGEADNTISTIGQAQVLLLSFNAGHSFFLEMAESENVYCCSGEISTVHVLVDVLVPIMLFVSSPVLEVRV